MNEKQRTIIWIFLCIIDSFISKEIVQKFMCFKLIELNCRLEKGVRGNQINIIK